MKRNKNTAGFTLVELVIVIAILGILGGVGAVGYNGYIVKSERAADQMIVAAVNKAFATACIEAGVDAMDADTAEISVVDGKVAGLSTFTFKNEAGEVVSPYVDQVAPLFNKYYANNEDMTFKTPNTNSLIWNKDEDRFEIKSDFVAMRVVLSNGKTLIVSAEDMAMIQASTYADMGYTGVKAVMDDVGESGETLAGICGIGTGLETSGSIWNGTLEVTGYNGLLPKLTSAMKAYGLIDAAKENEMLQNICQLDDLVTGGYKATDAERTQSIQEAANGLSMITAKYLAGGGNVDELIAVDLGDSSTGVIEPMATGTGGTKTVSAIAVQYALAAGFANSDASNGVTIEGKTVSEYLASADDPVKAIDTVKNLDAYKNNYVGTEQYNSDKNGFAGTMSILGDNIGTITDPGNIDINGYLTNGIDSADAKDALTSVLGE